MRDEKLSINKSTLVGIADAVRQQEGSSEEIPVSEIKSRILGLNGSGSSLKILLPQEWQSFPDSVEVNIDSFYSDGSYVQGQLLGLRYGQLVVCTSLNSASNPDSWIPPCNDYSEGDEYPAEYTFNPESSIHVVDDCNLIYVVDPVSKRLVFSNNYTGLCWEFYLNLIEFQFPEPVDDLSYVFVTKCGEYYWMSHSVGRDETGAPYGSGVYYSSDGLSWSKLDGLRDGCYLTSIDCDDYHYVLGCSIPTYTDYVYKVSRDLSSVVVSCSEDNPGPNVNNVQVKHLNGKWFCNGFDVSGYSTLYSTDLIHWAGCVSSTGLIIKCELDKITEFNDVLVCSESHLPYQDSYFGAFYSTDGVTWKLCGDVWPEYTSPWTVSCVNIVDGAIFICGQLEAEGSYLTIYSADGVTWNRLPFLNPNIDMCNGKMLGAKKMRNTFVVLEVQGMSLHLRESSDLQYWTSEAETSGACVVCSDDNLSYNMSPLLPYEGVYYIFDAFESKCFVSSDWSEWKSFEKYYQMTGHSPQILPMYSYDHPNQPSQLFLSSTGYSIW